MKNSNFTCLYNCLCCGNNNLRQILDLTDQPLANSYLKTSNEPEDYYPLVLNYCETCTHLQIGHAVNPDLLFKNYLYVSGTTNTLRQYFDKFVSLTQSYVHKSHPLNILDIACNDGSQLDAFKKYGHNTFGIDPAENLFELSSKNHTVICDYLTSNSMHQLHTKFDVIVAQNVFAHNTYPAEFLTIVKNYLTDGGKLFIQTSQADMVKYNQFDTIYHEHISFFNIRSMYTLLKRCGLYLEDVIKTSIHGTSYVFIVSANVDYDNGLKLLQNETCIDLEAVTKFANNSYKVVRDLKNVLETYKDSVLVGYGAAAKGNTLLNFGSIDLNFIVDDNPFKQELYTPGRKIKIVSLDQLLSTLNNVSIVWIPLSWNFYEEIKGRIKKKYDKQTTFIKYFPNLEVELY